MSLQPKSLGPWLPNLMDFTSTGGCAAKIDSQTLELILTDIELPSRAPHPLVGLADRDDAAVVVVHAGTGLVTTVDVVPPLVPDPYKWGWIAAANAVSDVYAMGGVPTFALSILGMPEALGHDVAKSVIEGAVSCLAELATPLLGGHSIRTPSPFFGLVVNGSVPIDKIWRKSGAQLGDALVLTRPIGIGILLSALKSKAIDALPDQAEACLSQTNAAAAEILRGFEVHAATDITGFGLAVQLIDLASRSSLSAEISMAEVPVLQDTIALLRDGVSTSLSPANRMAALNRMTWRTSPTELTTADLLFDPQTNGGLLAAMPIDQAAQAVNILRSRGMPDAAVIGQMVESPFALNIR